MNTPAEDPLVEFGRRISELDMMLRDPAIAKMIGPGIERELRFAMVSFRQKFPDMLPGTQPALL